jgi:hypothetical protein
MIIIHAECRVWNNVKKFPLPVMKFCSTDAKKKKKLENHEDCGRYVKLPNFRPSALRLFNAAVSAVGYTEPRVGWEDSRLCSQDW